jgi:hypothetical protein
MSTQGRNAIAGQDVYSWTDTRSVYTGQPEAIDAPPLQLGVPHSGRNPTTILSELPPYDRRIPLADAPVCFYY